MNLHHAELRLAGGICMNLGVHGHNHSCKSSLKRSDKLSFFDALKGWRPQSMPPATNDITTVGHGVRNPEINGASRGSLDLDNHALTGHPRIILGKRNINPPMLY